MSSHFLTLRENRRQLPWYVENGDDSVLPESVLPKRHLKQSLVANGMLGKTRRTRDQYSNWQSGCLARNCSTAARVTLVWFNKETRKGRLTCSKSVRSSSVKSFGDPLGPYHRISPLKRI